MFAQSSRRRRQLWGSGSIQGHKQGSDTRTFDRAWDGTNASAVEEAHPIQAVGWTPVLRGWRWRLGAAHKHAVRL
jgi:hypothetical protein